MFQLYIGLGIDFLFSVLISFTSTEIDVNTSVTTLICTP